MRNRYETNPLSLIEGGDKIKITFKNGLEREYSNVKSVEAYVAKVLRESECKIEKIEVEREVTVKEWRPVFGRVYGRSYTQTSI